MYAPTARFRVVPATRGETARRGCGVGMGLSWRGARMERAADPEVFALLVETNDLRAALEARDHETALLQQLLGTVLSAVDVGQLLRQIITHLQATVPCQAAFIYLWESGPERLVLRGASEPYGGLIGRVALRAGEGLVGWSARTGEVAMLRDSAMQDPRFRYFPELQEEHFQAVLTVPMPGAGGAVEAVVIMHTIAPQEFTEEHVRLVGALAPILGGAIAASRMYERAHRSLDVLSRLSTLLQGVRSGRLLDAALPSIARTTLEVTNSALCAVAFAELGAVATQLHVYALRGGEPVRTHTGRVDHRAWERLRLGLHPGPGALPELTLAPGLGHAVAPLVSAGEQIGWLACYRHASRPYGEDDRSLLTIIANQAAVAVRNSQLADLLVERDVPARLFRDLRDGTEDEEDVVRRRAALLGCDLTQPHLPILLEMSTDLPDRAAAHTRLAAGLRQWLETAHPGSLAYHEGTVQVLLRLPVGAADESQLVRELATQVARDAGPRVAGGVGRRCTAVASYRRGFAEAVEALRVCVRQPDRGVARFDNLGAMRYLVSMARPEEPLADRYQEVVLRLAEHDLRRNTLLLDTLETYLHCGGSLARAADRLYVHRNTLVQRLERIQEILGWEPRESEQWLALQIAIKLWRLDHTRVVDQR